MFLEIIMEFFGDYRQRLKMDDRGIRLNWVIRTYFAERNIDPSAQDY